jgi:type IV secretory pathway VirB10-like protein
MSQAPEDSPNELTPAPRRLNRVPLLIAGLLLSVLLAAVAYSYYARLAKTGAKPEEAQKPEPAPVLLKDGPDAGFIPREQGPPRPAMAPLPKEPVAPPEPQDEARKLAWESYRQKLERRRALREEATLQAVLANTNVGFTGVKPALAPSKESEPVPQSERFADLAERFRRLNGFETQDRDLNRASEKRDFLKDRGPQSASQNRLAARREEPSSAFELKASTIIPATMIGGVSSDLPGQILGQVSENVYDTATGRFILIPQGARLVGTYDNGITTGQERVLVAWTRIIFPDASALDLGKMPGADEGGFAGFHDEVDDHFLKVFGNAILLSVMSAGVQLSQGNANNQTSGLTTQQTIAAALGQQLGQLGQETARRNMQVQPTLEIRPGYRFVVMVTKDIVLRPWVWRDTPGGR